MEPRGRIKYQNTMRITSISFVSIIIALAVAHHPTFAIEKGVAEVNDDNNNNHNLLRQRVTFKDAQRLVINVLIESPAVWIQSYNVIMVDVSPRLLRLLPHHRQLKIRRL